MASSSPSFSELRIVQLTPPGRGAVATLLIEGRGAADAVETLFSPSKSKHVGDRPHVRRLTVGDSQGEDVVVWRAADDAVRLHCHGGVAAVERIVAALRQLGGRTVAWRDWAMDREADPLRASARVALADAPTRRSAAVLLDQFAGALSKACGEIRLLIESGQMEQAGAAIEQLLQREALGRHLTEPWRVVVAGRPNAGKSSLVNALAGFERAIVHALPGTTRDALTTLTAIDGWPVELVDTAGLRETDHPIERAGVRLAESQLAAADLMVLVFDSSGPWTEEDAALLASWSGGLIVHNKSDLPPHPDDRPEGLRISALLGAGLPELVEAIGRRLVPIPPQPGEPIPWAANQIAAFRQIGQAVSAGEPSRALSLLKAMVGRTAFTYQA